MRVSSVMRPSSSGTLRSARRKTRLPSTSTSRIVSLFMARLADGTARLEPRCHVAGQVCDPAAVFPVVVVPRDHLDQVLADNQGVVAVDAARSGRSTGVTAHFGVTL